jgi:hypothetical protein
MVMANCGQHGTVTVAGTRGKKWIGQYRAYFLDPETAQAPYAGLQSLGGEALFNSLLSSSRDESYPRSAEMGAGTKWSQSGTKLVVCSASGVLYGG